MINWFDKYKKELEVTISHPLFETPRWAIMLKCDSYYFPGVTNSLLKYDEISKSHFLTVRTNFKNYDHEIKKFLHWLAPYAQTGTFTPGTKDHPPIVGYDVKTVS